MTQGFRCGDAEALIGFLYEECSPDERAMIAAHLAICASCTGELASLAGTRQQLTMWSPPDARLDFRLTRAQARTPAPAWWHQPLPAWAQLAAAMVIFATGVLIGAGTWTSSATNQVAVENSQSTAAELAQLDARIRAVEKHPGFVVHTASVAPASSDVVVGRIRRELDERDARLYADLDALAFQLVKNAKAQQDSIKNVRGDVDSRLEPLVKAVELSSRGNGD